MITIIDYGVGNLFSLCSSFRYIGEEVRVTSDRREIENAKRLVLPGVGAFADARRKLSEHGLDEVILREVEKGKPLFGICLGMQMLLDRSYEYGVHEGLGLIRGEVRPISEVIPEGYKIPHIGWNALHFDKAHPLFRYLKEGDCVYFVHSYYATDCADSVIATAEYGAELTAAVAKGNVMGCQFHPEKSGEVGLNILRAFCEGASV
jgi:glutamine amidotransferase